MAILTLATQKLLVYQAQISLSLTGTVQTVYGLFGNVEDDLWIGDLNMTTSSQFSKQGFGIGMTGGR